MRGCRRRIGRNSKILRLKARDHGTKDLQGAFLKCTCHKRQVRWTPRSREQIGRLEVDACKLTRVSIRFLALPGGGVSYLLFACRCALVPTAVLQIGEEDQDLGRTV